MEDFRLKHAVDIISADYGKIVSVNEKKKDLRKFGENENGGTDLFSVMTLPSGILNETMLSTNGITHVVSDDAADVQNLSFYEGHTISSGELSFLKDSTATALTGLTGVLLNSPVARLSRARLSSPANGNIYFYEGGTTTLGVPDNLNEVHAMIPAGELQTQKASTSVSSTDFYIITGATATVLEKVASWGQFRIEIKEASASEYYPITEWIGVSDNSGSVSMLNSNDPYLIVPANHDVRIAGKTNTANIYVAGGMIGYLAKVLKTWKIV